MEYIPDYEQLWSDWDASLELPEQQKRLKASFSDKCKPHYISRCTSAATFTGEEGAFRCCLEDNFCNCEEHIFKIHLSNKPVPCMYMYRLAYELGLTDEQGRKQKQQATPEVSEADQHNAFRQLALMIEQYDEDTQYELYSKCRWSTKREKISKEYSLLKADVALYAPLIKDGFYTIIDEPLKLLGSQRELVRRLDDASFAFPPTLAKTKRGTVKTRAKYDWCLQNPAIVAPIAYPELVVVQPSALLQKGGDLLLKYLHRKFYDTIYEVAGGRKVQVPSGARIIDLDTPTYDYPNDVVTEMLNCYGHNRCLNYTEPREVLEHRPLASCDIFIPK